MPKYPLDAFVSTFIVARELNSEDVDKTVEEAILPGYYPSISGALVHAGESDITYKLVWNHVQKLDERDAVKSMLGGLGTDE